MAAAKVRVQLGPILNTLAPLHPKLEQDDEAAIGPAEVVEG